MRTDLALEAFAREARPLTADPPAELEAYIHQRLNCMLAEAGLAPEGELCTRQG